MKAEILGTAIEIFKADFFWEMPYTSQRELGRHADEHLKIADASTNSLSILKCYFSIKVEIIYKAIYLYNLKLEGKDKCKYY